MLKSATDVQAALVGFRIAEARNWCFAKVHLDPLRVAQNVRVCLLPSDFLSRIDKGVSK